MSIHSRVHRDTKEARSSRTRSSLLSSAELATRIRAPEGATVCFIQRFAQQERALSTSESNDGESEVCREEGRMRGHADTRFWTPTRAGCNVLAPSVVLSSMRATSLCLVALLLLTGCESSRVPSERGDAKTSVSTDTPVDGRPRIVFVDRNGNLTTLLPDGTGRDSIPITAEFSSVWDPRWSPDGARIAFTCELDVPEATQELCLVNRDGSGFTRLTDTPGGEGTPDWSPNGRWIAFQTGQGIEMIRPDGSDRRVVPHTRNSDELSWRHHRRIVFVKGSVDGGDIYTIRRDGTQRLRLTHPHDGRDSWPSWSPRGDRIVFARELSIGAFDLFTMRPNGSGERRLTRGVGRPPPRFWPIRGSLVPHELGILVMPRDGGDVRGILQVRGEPPLNYSDWVGRRSRQVDPPMPVQDKSGHVFLQCLRSDIGGGGTAWGPVTEGYRSPQEAFRQHLRKHWGWPQLPDAEEFKRARVSGRWAPMIYREEGRTLAIVRTFKSTKGWGVKYIDACDSAMD